MSYQCDIRILVFSHEKRKLLLLFSVLLTYGILVCFLWDSCENLVYARGFPWGNTARQCPQEIAFGILELTVGDHADPCVATVH